MQNPISTPIQSIILKSNLSTEDSVFDIELMKKYNISTDGVDRFLHKVLAIENHSVFGEIVTYKIGSDGLPRAQVNSCWIKLVR